LEMENSMVNCEYTRERGTRVFLTLEVGSTQGYV